MAQLSDDIEEQIDEAMRNARDFYDYEIAVSARYVAAEDLLLFVLKSGQRVAIPVEDLQDLARADRALVAQVELFGTEGMESALHWEALDVDFSVVGLVEGRFGNERWMEALPQRRRERLKAS